jgi:RNA polymerase sigma-70 factor (ECF subfamily)
MRRNRELFWELLEPEYSGAMMFCRKLTGDRERGDDLFQDALVTALSGFESLRDATAFRPWLYRILVNTFKSKVRRPWWKRRVALTPEIELTLTGVDPVEVHAARRWLGRAFRVLSTDDQALVTLHELEGWQVSELARTFGRSEGSIKTRLFRARRKMKEALISFSEKPNEQKAMRKQQTKLEKDDRCVAAKPGLD